MPGLVFVASLPYIHAMDTHSHHNHYPDLTFELTPHIIQKQSQNPEILGSALWGPALCLQIGQ